MRVFATGLAYNKPFDPCIHIPVALHGYEIQGKGTLGPLSRAVCECARLQLMTDVRMVAILLGGWRLYDPGPHTTIADVMQQWLLEQGVQRYQILTQRNLGLTRFMPPRDTWEELVLFGHIMNRLDPYATNDIRFVAWDVHVPRLLRMYEHFFPGRSTINFPAIPAPFTGLKKRVFIERMARWVQRTDSDGTSLVCRKARARRTLAQQGIPLIPE